MKVKKKTGSVVGWAQYDLIPQKRCYCSRFTPLVEGEEVDAILIVATAVRVRYLLFGLILWCFQYDRERVSLIIVSRGCGQCVLWPFLFTARTLAPSFARIMCTGTCFGLWVSRLLWRPLLLLLIRRYSSERCYLSSKLNKHYPVAHCSVSDLSTPSVARHIFSAKGWTIRTRYIFVSCGMWKTLPCMPQLQFSLHIGTHDVAIRSLVFFRTSVLGQYCNVTLSWLWYNIRNTHDKLSINCLGDRADWLFIINLSLPNSTER